ncbi:MAG: dimethylglycine dehydrogenase [Acidiferrobacteraceae bacterium]|nr:dimethylglycine dehydrogenase [Acidiferrobacteraceae bacterium]
MKSSARVVVIGGGVVGVSTLYHLAKKGWSDVVLVERKELTSGSTWHAAGLLPLFNMSYSVGQIHKYSVNLYRELEDGRDEGIGLRQVSNIRLACTADRMDEYHFYAGVAKTIGVDVRFLSPEEIMSIWPFCNIDGLIGGIQHPDDGYIQPADLTQALASSARQLGAEIYRNTSVLEINKRRSGEWCVITNKGEISCEHVVAASGNFARNVGQMVGLDIPVIPVEHQFIVTEPHPDIVSRHKEGLPEMGVLRDSDASFYMREENGGLLLGPYEKGAPCCYVDGPDTDAEYELFAPDLDRLTPHIEAAIHRVPIFGELGVKSIYNGAICYTPDGSPIVGPAWGLKNFWLNEGHSFGITAAGGAGWQLAEWIVEGEPSIDMMGVDPRRFGQYATKEYLRAKNEEAYSMVFTVHYPDEERSACRPLKQSPCYSRLKDRGAVFGSVFGWERANWFAPPQYTLSESELSKPKTLLSDNHPPPDFDGNIKERWSFRRSNYFDFVGRECRHVNEHVGLLDMTAFSKFYVKGPGAESWLDRQFANRIPNRVGRISLCHLLTEHGGVRSEFTVYKIKEDCFYLVSAGAFQRHDWDYMQKAMPRDGTVQLENVTSQYGVFVLAGPKSRSLLQTVTTASMESDDFSWLTGRSINIGLAQVEAVRVNFVGELGWELHHPIEMQNYIYDLLFDVGNDFMLEPFGIRAMDSLRLEKSYRLIPRELSIEYCAFESGLDRFIKLEKDNFVGKTGLLECQEKGLRWQFVTLALLEMGDADPRGSEPIYLGQELVGRCTSGGYGWRVQKSLALGMVNSGRLSVGDTCEVEILGKRWPAIILPESPYDPQNRILRE